jgi:hypothetical protein
MKTASTLLFLKTSEWAASAHSAELFGSTPARSVFVDVQSTATRQDSSSYDASGAAVYLRGLRARGN